MRSKATALCLAATALAASPSASAEGAPDAVVEAELRALVAKQYRPAGPDTTMKLSRAGRPLAIPDVATIDLERGSGHGFSLHFDRIELDPSGATVERVSWNGRRSAASVSRCKTDLASVARAVEAARLEPTLELTEVRAGGGSGLGLSGWSSSRDFFSLLRVSSGGEVLHEREYGGYEGSSKQLDYLTLVAALDVASRQLDGLTGCVAVTGAAMRTSHFTDAFALNRSLMLDLGHWWVMEYSVQALGSLGREEALPTLRFVRSHHKGLIPRQTGLLDRVIAAPSKSLSGPPVVLGP